MDITKRQLELIEEVLETSLEHLEDVYPTPQGSTNEFVRALIERHERVSYDRLPIKGFESKTVCISALNLVRKLLKKGDE